jgi:hypothetical protein
MKTIFKSIQDLKSSVISDPDLQKALINDPLKTVNNIQESSPLDTDKWIYRIVVSALGASILLIIIGTLFLIGQGKFDSDAKVPTILTAIGSAAIGALSGLLAPSPKSSK